MSVSDGSKLVPELHAGNGHQVRGGGNAPIESGTAATDEVATTGPGQSPRDAKVYIGRRELVEECTKSVRADGTDSEAQPTRSQAIAGLLKELRIRVGTLLKSDNVAFLLGAGCSLGVGGATLARIPYSIESRLIDAGADDQEAGRRLWLFYRTAAMLAARGGAEDTGRGGSQPIQGAANPCRETPQGRDALREGFELLADRRFTYAAFQLLRSDQAPNTEDEQTLGFSQEETESVHRFLLSRRTMAGAQPPTGLPANLEEMLCCLQHWNEALALDLLGPRAACDCGAQELTQERVGSLAREIKSGLYEACRLPSEGKGSGLHSHRKLVRKALTRPANLRRVSIFTLNYDTVLEQAMDAEGTFVVDGFQGLISRVFRPETFGQDLYFPAQTTEGRVHRLERVVHLYKLHGSLTWRRSAPCAENPFGLEMVREPNDAADEVIVYPTTLKYGETLGLPYSEMFRRFQTVVVQPQSVLFVIGYSFGDRHMNALILQALAMPSFTLVIVDPDPTSGFVDALKRRGDERVWVVQGRYAPDGDEGPGLGTFEGFVEYILPDLRDEEIEEKVASTQRALGHLVHGTPQTPDLQEGQDG